MEEQSTKKRTRDDSGESDQFDSPEFKRLKEDLLFMLDDSYPEEETQEDLVSVMKSFEDEISAPPSPSPAVVVDLTSDPGELGYLLEASDDELGLPPSLSSITEGGKGGDVGRGEAESDGIGELLWSGEAVEFPNYDAFELGDYDTCNEYGHVALEDGYFEYSNVVYDGTEFSGLS